MKRKYRIVEQNGLFYPQYKDFLFWYSFTKWHYVICNIVTYTKIDAELIIKHDIYDYTKHKKIIHKLKIV